MNKKWNKKVVAWIVSVLFVAVIAPVSVFAAWTWITESRVENNTVTVEQPVQIALTGSMEGAVRPGITESYAEATFNYDVTNGEAGKTYVLRITDIQDQGGESLPLDGWEYAVDGDPAAALLEGVDLKTVTTGPEAKGNVTLKISATADLDESWAGKALTFTLELVEKTAD